jgi:phosphatidyl-myo-inositol dimannoside synthase
MPFNAIKKSADDRPLVLFVAPYFLPAYYGGVVQVYLGLLQRMTAFRVVVVADRQGCAAADQIAWDAAALTRYPFRMERLDAIEFHLQREQKRRLSIPLLTPILQISRFLLRGRYQWKTLVAELRPDLIVCGGTYSAGWLMRAVPRSIPLVNYVHGEELTMQLSPRFLMQSMRKQQMRSLRAATLNVAVSQYTAQTVESLSGACKRYIKTLPNFVDTDRFRISGERNDLRRRFGWESKLVILTLARLEPRKGIDQALRALAMLDKAGRLPENCIYVIAGRGREGDELKALSEALGLSSRVCFYGFVLEADVSVMYEAADIFIQPNRDVDGDTEGFGVVFLEASACGTPVIGGIAGGTADAIAEGVSGFRVDGESIEEIARVLAQLIEDPELRRRLGDEGARRVASLFTAERAARDFEGLLMEVLAQRSNGISSSASD